MNLVTDVECLSFYYHPRLRKQKEQCDIAMLQASSTSYKRKQCNNIVLQANSSTTLEKKKKKVEWSCKLL
jgi:hypothetical protein